MLRQMCVHRETAVEPWARGTFIDFHGVGDEFVLTFLPRPLVTESTNILDCYLRLFHKLRGIVSRTFH